MPATIFRASHSVPRVLVLYNRPTLAGDDPHAESESEVVETTVAVEAALADEGLAVERLSLGEDFAALPDELADRRPDVVFNLFEGLALRPTTEALVGALLERSGVPSTGCPAQALWLAGGKHRAKRLLQRAGLPTPAFRVVGAGPMRVRPRRWPLIVKPALFDASVGIEQTSVVTCLAELDEQVSHVRRRFGPPVLVEQFIAGREFSVTLVEMPQLLCLPIVEVRFLSLGREHWPIYTYDGKWQPGSAAYVATPLSYSGARSGRLADRLEDLARRAFRLLGCRDFARVDFRVDASGRPFILEVNPNADLSPVSCLGQIVAAAGLDYGRLIGRMVENAWSRRHQMLAPQWTDRARSPAVAALP